MHSTVALRGFPAARGTFTGPVHVLSARPPIKHVENSGFGEQRMRRALAEARSELLQMSGRVSKQGRDVLSIQLALLEDLAITAPVFESMKAGAKAEEAWSNHLDSQISQFESDEDEQFRTRALDMCDLRDRILGLLRGQRSEKIQPGAVVFADDLPPSTFLECDWSKGGAIALRKGSVMSHVAMLARAEGVPMVVGIGAELNAGMTIVTVDGDRGLVHADGNAALHASRADPTRPLKTAFSPFLTKTGMRIELMMNVARLEDVAKTDPSVCDGIGLVRTEFLFHQRGALTSEEQQFRDYCALAEWAKGRPVVLRVFDGGGDKVVAGLGDVSGTARRGVELLLFHKQLLKTQLRAMVRAASHGDISILLPVVSSQTQILEVKALLRATGEDLAREGPVSRLPSVGIMVETVASAQSPDIYGEADFFAIGSNDLARVMQGGGGHQDAETVARVLELVGPVLQHAKSRNKRLCLCGELAGEPSHLQAVMAAGITCLSVAPSRIQRMAVAIGEA
jgi:phosphoenolpyruvate-protein phosphotransferase (PTS system enzyme I)